MPTRTASATWKGGLKSGAGTFRSEAGLSGSYTFGSRFESAGGSNPEELLAAAHAACFSMALSANLEKNGTPGATVDTTARCTIEKVGDGFRVTAMKLEVRASVPNVDDASFQRLAAAAKEGCPISQVMKGNVRIDLDAKLS